MDHVNFSGSMRMFIHFAHRMAQEKGLLQRAILGPPTTGCNSATLPMGSQRMLLSIHNSFNSSNSRDKDRESPQQYRAPPTCQPFRLPWYPSTVSTIQRPIPQPQALPIWVGGSSRFRRCLTQQPRLDDRPGIRA